MSEKNPTQHQERPTAAVALKRGAIGLLKRFTVPLILIALIVIFSVARPITFFNLGNLHAILTNQAALLALVFPLTVTLAVGELDLSIGGQLAFSSVLIAVLSGNYGMPVGLALLISFVAAVTVGLIHSLLIVKFKTNGLIITLSMATFLIGLAEAISGSSTVGGIPAAITSPFQSRFLGVGLPFWICIGIGLVLWYVMSHTPAGRRIYFTGEGREAARLAGIRVAYLRAGGFIVSAIGAWFGGLIVLGQTGAAQAGVGMPFLLPAYAAAFLGATAFTPGRFNIVGTFVAAYLLAVGSTGLQLFGLATWVTQVFAGGILILAVTFAAFVGVRES